MVSVGKPSRFVRGFSKHRVGIRAFCGFPTMRHFPQPFAPVVFSGWLRSRISPNGKTKLSSVRSRLQKSVDRADSERSAERRSGGPRTSNLQKSNRAWREQYLGKSLVERPSSRERQLEAENKKLKSKIADLVMEMDHIKKVQVWVQQKRSADTSVITLKNLDQFRKPAK